MDLGVARVEFLEREIYYFQTHSCSLLLRRIRRSAEVYGSDLTKAGRGFRSAFHKLYDFICTVASFTGNYWRYIFDTRSRENGGELGDKYSLTQKESTPGTNCWIKAEITDVKRGNSV